MADTTAYEELPFTTRSRQESVQANARNGRDAGISVINFLSGGGYRIPAWWSPQRDIALRRFWKESDHLAGALYVMIAKMTSIPFRVVPLDPSNLRHAEEAEERAEALRSGTEFGEGWPIFYAKFIEDLLSQDNGTFAEIIGPGRPDGPLTGKPYTLAHLDAYRCRRTGNPEFPVLYQDTDGALYKLHYTRVLYTSQMPSPIAEMFGVGFCAVSRCVNVAQTLIDVLTYKMEKLGSRPHRALLITQGGLDPDDVSKAFQVAESMNSNTGFTRYGKLVTVGAQTIPDANMALIELSKLPDGFNEETSLTLGMATISLAFGVDARELFPSLSSGSTRADALLQHLKQRGKGPGQIIEVVEQLLNYKYLPPYLKIKFDFQDDAEDQQAADIRATRAKTRGADILAKIIDERTARQQMLSDGEITDGQFEMMEMKDGRLVNGTSILSLFYVEQPPFSDVLNMGIENIEDVQANSPEEVLSKIAEKRAEIHKLTAGTKNFSKQLALLQAEAALNALETLYTEAQEMQMQQEQQELENEVALTRGNMPGEMRDKRNRKTNLAAPNTKTETATGSGNRQNKIQMGKDEKVKEAADEYSRDEYMTDLPARINASLERFQNLMAQAEQEAGIVTPNGTH